MKEVKEYYDKYNYPKINCYTKKQEKRHAKLMEKILSYSNLSKKQLNGKKLLDAGCGTGEKAIFFSKNKADVTAIDFSSGQLNVLKERKEKNNLKLRIIKMDLLESNFKNLGKFDLIFCTGVLHHTENPYKGFLNLVSCLKKDGVIVIALYHKFARIRYRLIRFFLHLFYSRNPQKLEYFFQNSKFFSIFKNAPKNSIYDRYLVPYESYHTINEVKNWFLKNNIELLRYSKDFNNFEFLNIFNKKTLFFISGTKK
jgi:2-polyprenyl-3-methyl-5-hydroxy-6-metoxy-1,4-benzoquinol methylase